MNRTTVQSVHLAHALDKICVDAITGQVEAMREQIRILEGIWGDEPVPASTTSHGDETPEKNGPRPRRNEARSEGHRRLADIVDRVGEREPRTENAARSSEADGGDGPGGAETDEGKGKKICDGEGGDDPEAGDRGLREGGQEGEGGVDAWLISYNRRLKSELERLRGRARQAEERYVWMSRSPCRTPQVLACTSTVC